MILIALWVKSEHNMITYHNINYVPSVLLKSSMVYQLPSAWADVLQSPSIIPWADLVWKCCKKHG